MSPEYFVAVPVRKAPAQREGRHLSFRTKELLVALELGGDIGEKTVWATEGIGPLQAVVEEYEEAKGEEEAKGDEEAKDEDDSPAEAEGEDLGEADDAADDSPAAI